MKDEKYFICERCGELTTESEQIILAETAGSIGMCYCEFTRPFFNEKYDDLDVETPRIFIPFIEISKKW